MQGWEFDSLIDMTGNCKHRVMQVWSREHPHEQGVSLWTVTEHTDGRENPPKAHSYGYGSMCAHWTSLEAFKKQFPHFQRSSR